jgi:exo-1,4-beta-D-glucosaminidase
MIQSTADVAFGGEELSRPGRAIDGWFPAAVPSTVLAALVADGRYEDPYVGMNLRNVPEESFRSPWWYRTEFALSQGQAGGAVLLEFDGINYAADVWLNGRPVAGADRARGAFRRFQYDVSGLVVTGRNVLAVEVVPPRPGDFTIGFVDWNPPAPDRDMGLFRPVRLRFCDGVSIENPFVQTRLDLATPAEARLTVCADVVNHSDRTVAGVLEGRLEGIHFRRNVHLPAREAQTVAFTPEDCAQLRVVNPRLWWPHDLGTPELYSLDLRFVIDSQVSDAAAVRFGVRDVADYRTAEGHRGFKVNGREVLIKGAGWTDDLLLADTPETIAAELQYVRHMNLNCIRCESIWGKDQTLYDLCDEYGILMMVGWSCQWEHEQYLGKPVDERYGGVLSPEDIELVSQSWQDQLLWLRNHPSIFVWAVASDKLPAPPLERRYIDIFGQYDPTRPYLVSTGGVGSEQRIVCREELVSEVSGSSGVKMLGPYEYTPPVYWYTDTRRGGAYGFNTETSPGAVVPTLESIKKMIPPDHLWPIDQYWDFHCGLNEFNKLDRYREAVAKRYGEASSVEEFSRKAQVLNYELLRPMFEAFRVHRGRATGVIQWMLNAAWPKMYWQLYDWFLMPTGAFYGAKKACEPLQLIYNYGDGGVYLVGCAPHTFPNVDPGGTHRAVEMVCGAHPTSVTADIRVYDIESQLLLAAHFPVEAKSGAAQRVFRFPHFNHITPTYFLSLRLLDAFGAQITDNFYWLSTTPDVLDYEAKVTPWEYYTPSRQYANLTLLNCLPPAEVDAGHRFETIGQEGKITVELANRSDRIAFGIELLLADDAGEPIVPVFWRDNYVSLLPKETRVLTAAFPATAHTPALIVRGWNLP